MESEKALKELCLKCEKEIGKRKVACPCRSISNEYCAEYESIKNDLELLKILRKYLIVSNSGLIGLDWVSFFNSRKDNKRVKELLNNEE